MHQAPYNKAAPMEPMSYPTKETFYEGSPVLLNHTRTAMGLTRVVNLQISGLSCQC